METSDTLKMDGDLNLLESIPELRGIPVLKKEIAPTDKKRSAASEKNQKDNIQGILAEAWETACTNKPAEIETLTHCRMVLPGPLMTGAPCPMPLSGNEKYTTYGKIEMILV